MTVAQQYPAAIFGHLEATGWGLIAETAVSPPPHVAAERRRIALEFFGSFSPASCPVEAVGHAPSAQEPDWIHVCKLTTPPGWSQPLRILVTLPIVDYQLFDFDPWRADAAGLFSDALQFVAADEVPGIPRAGGPTSNSAPLAPLKSQTPQTPLTPGAPAPLVPARAGLDRSSQAELERLRARFESLSLAARQTVHLASQAATSLHFLEKCGPILAIVEGQGYVERLPAEGTSRRSSATPTPAPPDRDGLLRDVPLCNTPGAQVSPAGGSVEVSRASTPTPTPSLESSRSNEFGRLTASRHQLESLHKRLARIETALDGVVTCVRAMTDTHGETVAPSRAGGTARLGRQGGKRLLSSLVLIASGALLGAVALSLYQSQVGP